MFWAKKLFKNVLPNLESKETTQLSIKSSIAHFKFYFSEWIESGIYVFKWPENLARNFWWFWQKFTLCLHTLALQGLKMICLRGTKVVTINVLIAEGCKNNTGIIRLAIFQVVKVYVQVHLLCHFWIMIDSFSNVWLAFAIVAETSMPTVRA